MVQLLTEEIETAAVKIFLLRTKTVLFLTLLTIIMKNKLLFLLFFISCILLACSDKNESVIISGNIKNADSKTLRLALVTVDGLDIIDSIKLKNGNFKFVIKDNDERFTQLKEAPMMFQLFLSEDNSLSTMAIHNDKLKISADASDLTKTYNISGGEDAVLIHQLDSALLSFITPVEKLYDIYQNNIENDSIREDIENQYNKLLQQHRKYLTDFIDNHPYNMASYIAFYQSYNRREFFDVRKDIEILKKINSNLLQKYPNSDYVKTMIHLVKRIENNN